MTAKSFSELMAGHGRLRAELRATGVERATEIAVQLAEVEFGLIEVRQTSRDPHH